MGKSKDLATLAANGLTTLKATNLEADTIKNSSGTSAISINSSGVITKDVVPAWRVCLTSNQAITSSGTRVTVLWDNTTSGNFNFLQGGCTLSSGVITVPVTGFYQCNVLTRYDGISGGYLVTRIVKNNDEDDKKELYTINGSPPSNYINLNGGDVFSCTSGDTLRVTVYSQSDSSFNIDHNGSKFSGFLIG
jgi:DNA/RNA endonuclease YhcR with UshA esterase domain